MKKKFINYFVITILVILIGITYQDLTKLYYLNDEWLQFGLAKVHGIFAGIDQWSIQEVLLGKGRPLGTLVNNIIFYYFPYNVLPFAVVSWLMHFGNSYLVYLIAKKVSKNVFISAITSLFFSVSQISYQSFAWAAAAVQVGVSSFFVFSAIYLFMLYLDNKRFRYALFAWLSAYISILLKDSSISIIVFLPLLSFLYVKKSLSLYSWIRSYWFVIVGVIGFSLYRLLSLLELSSRGVGSLFVSQLAYRYLLYIWNMIFYPIVSLAHFFIPFRYMYRLADILASFFYPSIFTPQFISQQDMLLHTIVPDFISVLFFIPLVAILLYCYFQDKALRKTYIYAVVYYIVMFIPYAVYLDYRNGSYVESRYMYLQSFGIGLLIGGLSEVFKNKINILSKNKYLGWVFVVFIISFFLIKQSSVVRREIRVNAYESADIKRITTEVKKSFPTLPLNPIIYLDGNRSYFFYSNMRVPLQIGPGYVFFLLYYDQIGSPDLFDKSFMLWQLSVQWYEEANGKGYGYFYDKEKLKLFMRQNNNISIEQLVGIYYNSDTKKFEDRTVELREYILN